MEIGHLGGLKRTAIGEPMASVGRPDELSIFLSADYIYKVNLKYIAQNISGHTDRDGDASSTELR